MAPSAGLTALEWDGIRARAMLDWYLKPGIANMLVALIQSRGGALTHAQLRAVRCRDGRGVSDDETLNRCIFALRSILEDLGVRRTAIKTLLPSRIGLRGAPKPIGYSLDPEAADELLRRLKRE